MKNRVDISLSVCVVGLTRTLQLHAIVDRLTNYFLQGTALICYSIRKIYRLSHL